MSLMDAAKRVAEEFEFTADDVRRVHREFVAQMEEGLHEDGKNMSQIPTFVTAVPNGTEKGLYMAVDLGGTNFRVCSIKLNGDTTFSITQSKVPIPKELMVAKTAEELFAFLAQQIKTFLEEHHTEHYYGSIERRGSTTANGVEQFQDAEVFKLGFTFSFPVRQVAINKGYLMRWTKGFDIADAIDRDVCALLQDEIDKLKLPVRVAALVNDTVGTLVARSYTSPGETGTLLGAIFGTGTNGAYVEKLDRLTKMGKNTDFGEYDKSTGDMVVNMEWGSFDLGLKVLPNTEYDREVDAKSVNRGMHLFEKRISGMYLGEILRLALLKMIRDPAVPLFVDESSAQNDTHSTTQVLEHSGLLQQWGLDTSFLSIAHGDASPGLRITRQTLDNTYRVSTASEEDAQAVKLVASAIGRRAARLSAVAIGAVVAESGRLEAGGDVDVGVDGSLVEFYPGFEHLVREALREIPDVAEAEERISIGIAKDGSGVGAALIALVAGRMEKAASGA